MQYDQRMMHKIQPIYLILYDMAQAIGGFATDTPCASAYAAHTTAEPSRYVQAHTRAAF